IFDQFQSSFNGPAANMLAGVLALLCLLLLTLESAARGNARYARVGSGSARQPQLWQLSRTATALCLLLPMSLSLLALGVPLITLARWLIAGGGEAWQQDGLLDAVQQTLMLASVGAVLITAAAFPIAWLSIRAPSRFNRLMESCNYITS